MPAEAAAPWCEDEKLLASLCGGFSHLPCSELQSAAGVAGFLALLTKFLRALVSELQTRRLSAMPELALNNRRRPGGRPSCRLPPRLTAGPALTPLHLLRPPLPPQEEGCQKGDASSQAALWPGLRKADLAALSGALRLLRAPDSVVWFPEFGAALLALRAGEDHIQASADEVALKLVALDRWAFEAHRWAGRGRQVGRWCDRARLWQPQEVHLAVNFSSPARRQGQPCLC